MRLSRIWDMIRVLGNIGFSYLGILSFGAFPLMATTSRIRECNTLKFGNSYIWDIPTYDQVLTIPRMTNSRSWESDILSDLGKIQFTVKR